MINLEEKIALVKAAMFEQFPNCYHTINILLWDDGDYKVTAQHGKTGELHKFIFYSQDPIVRYEKETFQSHAVKFDAEGNSYYVPYELISHLNQTTKEKLILDQA